LISANHQLSFGELYQQVRALQAALQDRGMGPGERVAVRLYRGEDFVHLAHAVTGMGGVLVPIHHRLPRGEVIRRVHVTGSSFLVSDEKGDGFGHQMMGEISEVTCLGLDRLREKSGTSVKSRRVDLNDLHSLVFTSGCSGLAKAVRLTWGNHFWNATGSMANLGLRDDDRWLACLSFCHVGGLAILMRSLLHGISVVVQDGFDAGAVNRSIDEEGITVVSLVSAMLRQVLDARGSRPFPGSLRCVLLGGGPIPESLLRDCVDLGVPVRATYGLTEAASQVCTASPETARLKPLSVGKCIFPTEIRIQVEGGQEAPPGVRGEILVRGPSVTSGYQEREGIGKGLSAGGWWPTGDAGYLDDEGDLFVLGRVDDVVVTGGENVSPSVVEAALLEHAAVEDVGVVGLPNDTWGEVLAATIVLAPGMEVSAGELKDYCGGVLARHEVPRLLRFSDSLPRSALGKLLRADLREQWQT
jgi:O-succinylbenzoic acid--CoA ligase